ncbi:MAG TPA: acetyl-coenzyme A synthetase N-terminal domain-containing protein, partial [Ktedonobacterales bacterium]|nr:acetyl-coenzyme A synthetase N-terminal domain-containing protein [Ktedonobacterales bacterium]
MSTKSDTQGSSAAQAHIDALLQEQRRFPPPPAFAAAAVMRDPAVYQRAYDNPDAFWAEAARRLDWVKPFERVLEWNAPNAKWFVGGQINASYN